MSGVIQRKTVKFLYDRPGHLQLIHSQYLSPIVFLRLNTTTLLLAKKGKLSSLFKQDSYYKVTEATIVLDNLDIIQETKTSELSAI